MNEKTGRKQWKMWLVAVATLVLCIGLGATPAFAAAPYVPVFNTNSNLTLVDGTGATLGGGNDIWFTWDGTVKTAVAVSGQVANATLSAYSKTFTGMPAGTKWAAHDVAVYGPGTYTVKASCAAKAPGCATGTGPITFTVGAGQLGAHMLVDYGTVSTNKNIDVVNVWTPGVFSPSTMYAGAPGSNSASRVWDLMSTPDPATPTINGYATVDGPNIGTRWNFNLSGSPLVGTPLNMVVDTTLNNFTMIDSLGATFGGTNDVRFTWDGTMKTAVAASGQVSNASLFSTCAFFGGTWAAHDVAVYAPGTYTVFADCPAGSPGCPAGTNAVTFTVAAGELGAHMLFYWNGSDNITVVDVWQPNLVFGPSVMNDNTTDGFVYGCLTNPLTKVWDHMSYDWDGDGINGAPMPNGPFAGANANFNVMGNLPAGCVPADCNDSNACTSDACVGTTCVHTPIACVAQDSCHTAACDTVAGCVQTAISCDDSNLCTSDSCNTATGCVHTTLSCVAQDACHTAACDAAAGCVQTAIVCNDNLSCTTDSCNTATGCVFTNTCPSGQNCTASGCSSAPCTSNTMCNDSNACTTDVCNTATGVCSNTPITCNDNDACTTDTCNTATGCVFAPIVCNDNLACTTDSCNTATGCVFTNTCPSGQTCTASGCSGAPCTSNTMCNDNNACTTDVCNTATGVCSNTPITCNDNNACTTDTCNTATGCVFTPLVCNDNNACTTDTCNTSTGCVFTSITCPAGQTCDPATGCVVVNPCTGKICNDSNACTTDTCDTATGNCVFTTVICPTGSTCDPATGSCVSAAGADVGVLQFLVPREIDNCKEGRRIIIVAKNFSRTRTSGTISLFKDDVLVKEWTDVVFKKRSAIVRSYFYDPSGDGGKTVNWKVVIDVPNDPNLSNNTSIKTTTVEKCGKHGRHDGHDGDGDDDHGHDRDNDHERASKRK